jgi:hypothetical protein
VRDNSWLGKKIGELLKSISESSFELFITVDRNSQYQQNLESISLTIIVLCGSDNRRGTLKNLIPNMFVRLELGEIHSVIEIY